MVTFFYALCLSLLSTSLLAAAPSEGETLRTLRSLNMWSPVESAASHGITGLRVGAGMTSFSVPESSQATFAQETQYTGASRVFFPKLLVTKGLWYPLDVGLVYGHLSTINQWGGYAQWTLFEALAMPAFALRGTYSRLTGLEAGALESGGINAIASWGIPFLTGFVYCGTAYNRGFLLATAPATAPTAKTWWQPEAGVGVNLTLLPPFVVLGVEVASLLNTDSGPVLQAKLSVGM